RDIARKAYPILKDIYENRGAEVTNISVPFTDGNTAIQIIVNLEKAVRTEGMEIITAFERNVTLATIDEEWKEHLREMDDLKQAVQQAVYEQKDPLLIYKLESFNLFSGMLARLNKDVLALLFKGHILSQDPQRVQEARQPRQNSDMNKLQTSRTER